jgi:hypothetical protein
VCTNVDVYSYVVLSSSLPPLFLTLSHGHTHTQWNKAKLSMSSNSETVVKKKLKKSLIETLKYECDLTRTNPHTQKEK